MLFTFGTSRGGAYLRQGVYFFFEKELNVMFKTKHEEINHLKELDIHIDLIVEKIR